MGLGFELAVATVYIVEIASTDMRGILGETFFEKMALAVAMLYFPFKCVQRIKQQTHMYRQSPIFFITN